MPHSKDVKRLLYSENPPEPAPAYPGRKSRNNTSGSTLTWQEFLQEEADQWVLYVMTKPSYSTTFMADKTKCLMQHLRNTKKSKLTQAQLRKLIESAERRLLIEQDSDQEVKNEQGEVQEQELASAKLDEPQNKEIYTQDRIGEEEEDENDQDWCIKGEKNKRFKGRWERESKIEKLLSMSDQELFGSIHISENDSEFDIINSNTRFIERREQYGREYL